MASPLRDPESYYFSGKYISREKTSAIRNYKNYNHNFEFMRGRRVVGSGGGVFNHRTYNLVYLAGLLISLNFEIYMHYYSSLSKLSDSFLGAVLEKKIQLCCVNHTFEEVISIEAERAKALKTSTLLEIREVS